MSSEDCVNSDSCDEIVIAVFYNGCFLKYPFEYSGEVLELKLSKVTKLSYEAMCNLLIENVKDDIWCWFYNKPNCTLDEGLTLVENDRDVKKMYKMVEMYGYLEVYVCHFPQYVVTDYYLKNLFVDHNDVEVTELLRSHEKIKKDFPGLNKEDEEEWEKKEISSPCYIFSPDAIRPRVFTNDLKGKSLLEEFDGKKFQSSESPKREWISGKSLIVDFDASEGEG